MIDHWRTGHSLAFACWLVTQGAGSKSLDTFIRNTLSPKGEDGCLDRLSSYALHFVQNMSKRLASQELIHSDPLAEYASDEFSRKVGRILSGLHGRRNELPSVVRATRMVADIVLYGIVPSPLAMQRIGWRSLSREEWRLNNVPDGTAEWLQEIRYGTTTADKIDAIEALLEACRESGISTGISELAFRLFDGVFAWPVVVLDAATVHGYDVGFGLPIGIDVAFDNGRSMLVRRDGHLTFEARELDTAVHEAKRLFKRNCGRYYRSPDRKDEVANASVSFDLSYAEAFLESTTTQVSVRGGSATPGLAVGVFARFVHDGNPPSVALTAEFEDGGRGVREIASPAGRVSKLEWARIGGRYDRVVIPRPDNSNDVDEYLRGFKESKERVYPPEVVDIRSLSVAADAMLPGVRWRRFSFCRTPEIRWELVRKWNAQMDGRQPIDGQGIQVAREALRNCREAVCRVREEITSVDVALALDEIDETGRALRDPLRVAFVGLEMEDDGPCYDGSPGERLLALVGSAVGVPQRDLGTLVVDERACVRAILDSERRFFRAPDVLVLIVAVEPMAEGKVAGLLDLVRQLGEPARKCEWNEHLGACRVVVVRDAVDRGRVHGDGNNNIAVDLGKLSIFRYGFTQHMATRVLEIDERETDAVQTIRTKLRDFVDRKMLRVVGGHYHITEMGRHVAAGMDEPAWFAAHRRAARAFMSPMTVAREPGMAEMEARRIENVREAEYHCQQVMRFTWNENASGEDRAAGRAALAERMGQKKASLRELIYLNCCCDMSACQFLGWVATWDRWRSDVFWDEAQSDFISLLEQRARALGAGEIARTIETAGLLVKLLSRGIERLRQNRAHFGLPEEEMRRKRGVFCALAVEKLETECQRLENLGDREQRGEGMAWVRTQAETLVADCSEADGVIRDVDVDADTREQLLRLVGRESGG